jgi:hypothetical protein
MTHEKLVAGTTSPTRYTKIIRNPGAGTKYNRTYQETEYVSRYTKLVAGGKDYVPPAPPEPPEPEPIPETTIGYPTVTVDGVEAVFGEPVHTHINTAVEVVATITGDAQPTYKWEARGGYPLDVSEQAATTTLTFPSEGGPTVTLTITDSNASDSPVTYAMNFYVASQAEWDMLHPTTTN